MTTTAPQGTGSGGGRSRPEADPRAPGVRDRAAEGPGSRHIALYRAWRAQDFAGIVGQEATVAALRNAVRTGRVAHALLFVGPRGTGKTSMARIVAKALNCTDLHDGEPCDRCPSCVSIREGTSLDVAELDAASNNKVDDIRELLPRIATAPSDLRRKVFIVDEVQRIKDGWDVLLKTLEEPPDHVAFIFCTTDASQIRPAVLSRVQRYDFRKLTVDQIAGKLRRILGEIGRDADDDAVDVIARAAAGGMRDAESMLDQLLAGAPERLTSDRVRDVLGLAEAEAVEGFVAALLGSDPSAGLGILDSLDERGRDIRSFLDQVMEALRTRLVASLDGRADPAGTTRTGLVAAGRRLAAIDPARLGPGGLRFQLELALLAATEATPVVAPRPPAPPPAVPAQVAAPAPPERAPASSETPLPVPGASTATPRRRTPATEPQAVEPDAASSPIDTVAVAGGLSGVEPPGAVQPPATGARPARPAAAPETGPPVPTPATAVSAEVEELLAKWPAVVEEMSRQPALKPIIVESRPMSVDGAVVTLGFPESKAFLRDIADRKRAAIEEGVARVIGRPVAIRCVVTNLDLFAPLPDAGEAGRLLAEARRIFADDLVDVGEVG